MRVTEEQQLSNAILLAAEAHVNQFDKGGKPYILHPLYLMHKLSYDPQLATIAVLHDVIEDSEDTMDELGVQRALQELRDAGYSERVVIALDLLTHRIGDDYMDDYIPGISTNIDAIRVKRKDLEHNSSITRLKKVTENGHDTISSKHEERIVRYHRAFLILGEARENF